VHHVVQRGNDGRPIFLDDPDRRRYLRFLEHALKSTPFRVHAYCLLGNHLHLVVETEAAPLSGLLHRLGGRYARAFNARWGRRGHLFQGRFFSRRVADDSYLLAAVRYVHANPVKAGIAATALDYPWSSHAAYVLGGAPAWLHVERVLSVFDRDMENARAEYGRWFDSTVIRTEGPPPVAPGGVPAGPTCAEEIAASLAGRVAREFGLTVDELRCGTTRRSSQARGALVLLAKDRGRPGLRRMAADLQRSPAALSEGARALARRISTEPALARWWDGVRRRCSD
jgi:putative transposase